MAEREITDAELGDPSIGREGDPVSIELGALSGAEFQLIIGALQEVPAKFSHRLLNRLEQQRDKAVLDARRAIAIANRAKDAEKLRQAAERRDKKAAKVAARAARKNSSAAELSDKVKPA